MAKTEKQIQIPETLFTQMSAFVLMEEYRTPENTELIKKGIYQKIDRQIEHELYSKFKTAPSAEQKELARQEYLDRKGIHKDFRW